MNKCHWVKVRAWPRPRELNFMPRKGKCVRQNCKCLFQNTRAGISRIINKLIETNFMHFFSLFFSENARCRQNNWISLWVFSRGIEMKNFKRAISIIFFPEIYINIFASKNPKKLPFRMQRDIWLIVKDSIKFMFKELITATSLSN